MRPDWLTKQRCTSLKKPKWLSDGIFWGWGFGNGDFSFWARSKNSRGLRFFKSGELYPRIKDFRKSEVFYPGDWGLLNLGIYNHGIFIPGDWGFSKIWGFLSRGLGTSITVNRGFLKNLRIFVKSLGFISRELKIFYLRDFFVNFFFPGFFGNWDFFSWNGISHQKATSGWQNLHFFAKKVIAG